jgi:hypothetical protein
MKVQKTDSDSAYQGSNPCPPANKTALQHVLLKFEYSTLFHFLFHLALFDR